MFIEDLVKQAQIVNAPNTPKPVSIWDSGNLDGNIMCIKAPCGGDYTNLPKLPEPSNDAVVLKAKQDIEKAKQGFLNSQINNETFFQKHKNHLLIVGALVVGYFAYKKFKK